MFDNFCNLPKTFLLLNENTSMFLSLQSSVVGNIIFGVSNHCQFHLYNWKEKLPLT